MISEGAADIPLLYLKGLRTVPCNIRRGCIYSLAILEGVFACNIRRGCGYSLAILEGVFLCDFRRICGYSLVILEGNEDIPL